MSRARYVTLALITIAAGLVLHRYGGVLKPSLRDFLGDVLWAMMIAWWLGALSPESPVITRTLAAIAICFGVEASQLIHFPLVDSPRATTIGQLTLGSGFDPRDLVAYVLGVVISAMLVRAVQNDFTRQTLII